MGKSNVAHFDGDFFCRVDAVCVVAADYGFTKKGVGGGDISLLK